MKDIVDDLPRLLWMLIDGFPHWLLDRYARDPRRRAAIPALAGVLDDGRVSPLLPVWPNCQTPPSLSTLWSGMEPLETGITGFNLPQTGEGYEDGDPMAIRPAFAARPPHVRFLWDLYASRGHHVRLCHIPFVTPERLAGRARYVSYGFGPPVRKISLMPAQDTEGRAGWQREDLGDDVATTTATWSLPQGPVRVDLGAWVPQVFGDRSRETAARMKSAAPFLGSAPNGFYRSGGFGPRLDDGGDGAAERLLAAALVQMARRYIEEFLDSVAQNDSRLVIGYLPALDIMLHEFAGYLDPACAFWSEEREAVIDPLVFDLVARIDRFLVRLQKIIGPADSVLVCSDHGMASLDTLIYPNTALERRGYLVRSAAGGIDPARSACFFHPAETGVLWVNEARLAQNGLTRVRIAADLCDDFHGLPGGRPSVLPVGGRALAGYAVLGHLRPGARQQAKATLTGDLWHRSRKCGEHGSHCDDARLQGVVLDLCRTRCRVDNAPLHARDVAAAFLGCRIPQGEMAHA